MKTIKEAFEIDPVDQANLDLHFVEAFLDLLGYFTVDKGTLDTVKTSTIATMCFESRAKIEGLKRFIESVPLQSKGAKAA